MEKRIRNKKLQLLVTAGRALWTITVDQISLCGEQHFFSALLSLCGLGGSSLPKQMLFSSCFFVVVFFYGKSCERVGQSCLLTQAATPGHKAVQFHHTGYCSISILGLLHCAFIGYANIGIRRGSL